MGGIQQLVKLAEERTTATTAAFATLALAVTSIIARLVGGKVFPRFALGRVITMLSFFQMIALAGLALSYNTWVFFAFILFFGATVGNILMLQPLLCRALWSKGVPKIVWPNTVLQRRWRRRGRGYSVASRRCRRYETAYLVAAGMSLAGVFVFYLGGPAENTTDHTKG